MPDATITFEQPLNEHIRACLRLEHLFKQIDANIKSANEWECRVALSAILEAINVIDRPDLKSKFTKVLTQYASLLMQLEGKPQIDKAKLCGIQVELDQLIDGLHRSQEKMGQGLRINPFLTTIRQHLANPAGAVPFSTPAYHLWLQKPIEQRRQSLMTWLQDFDQLRALIKLLLQLTRASILPQTVLADGGFYQQALAANIPYQLIRIIVPVQHEIYPEISAGKHRLSIRFYDLNIQDRPSQTAKSVPFQLACCVLLGA